MTDSPLLVIPTRGRPNKQLTGELLEKAGFAPWYVGNTHSDIPPGPKKYTLFGGEGGLTAKRNFILDHFGPREKMIVFDDDLTFKAWSGQANRYVQMNDTDACEMIQIMWDLLDHYPLVGVLPRFIARSAPDSAVLLDRKVYHAIGTNFSLVKGECPRFHGVVAQDTDMNLQILTRGYQTAVSALYVHEDKPDSAGGCSIYRTEEMKLKVYAEMTVRWPGICTISDEGKPRVSWLKAIAKGAQMRNEQIQ